MNELPKGWSYSRLDEVATIIRGVTYSSKGVLQQASPDAVMLLRATNIQNGVLDFLDPVWIPRSIVKSPQMLIAGDVVIASSSGSIQIVGKSASVKGRIDATFGAFCTTVRATSIEPAYLAHYLQDPTLRQKWSDLAGGSNINNLKTTDIAATQIAVPPLDEQKRIVEALDDHLSRLDKALAEVEHGRAREKHFKRSLLHSLFENLEADVLELGEVSKPKYGKDVPKHLRGESFTYPVVGSAGVMTYTEVPLVEEPSVLVGRKGNVGAVQMFPTPCSPVDTAYYLVCPDDVDLEFMYFQLQSIDLKALDSSTTIPSLRRQDLEAVQFRKPDLATQKKIAEEIKVKLASVDAALDELSNIAAALSVLRRSLLNAAFTGALLKVVR